MITESKEKQQQILKSLAVAWAERAIGKMSHSGFYACMDHVRHIVPSEVWDKLSNATLHYHTPLEIWIKEVKKEIPTELLSLIGGDMPSIDRLQKMTDEFEEIFDEVD